MTSSTSAAGGPGAARILEMDQIGPALSDAFFEAQAAMPDIRGFLDTIQKQFQLGKYSLEDLWLLLVEHFPLQADAGGFDLLYPYTKLAWNLLQQLGCSEKRLVIFLEKICLSAVSAKKKDPNRTIHDWVAFCTQLTSLFEIGAALESESYQEWQTRIFRMGVEMASRPTLSFRACHQLT